MKKFLTIILLAAAVSGCSGMTIQSDFDPTADFKKLETWDWMEVPSPKTGDPRQDNAILHGRIQSAIANTLLDRGFKLNLDDPDFFVAFHVAINQKLEMEVVNNYYGYPYQGTYAAVWGPSIQGQEMRATEWEQGTLLIDILDAESRQLVWRGSAQAEIYPDTSPNERQKNINKAAEKVLSQFPPR